MSENAGDDEEMEPVVGSRDAGPEMGDTAWRHLEMREDSRPWGPVADSVPGLLV
jgi:hypothetical protein